MKKAIILLIAISMICVSMSGAAVSVNNSKDNSNNNVNILGLPLESPEVNERVLNNFNQEVDKYLNFDKYNNIDSPPKTNQVKEINYPWHSSSPVIGDFIEWIIHVDYNDEHFQEQIAVNPNNFRDRFLEHPWHYEKITFDTNEDGTDDLDVYYSIFFSQLANIPEGIDTKSIRSCLKIRTEDMLDRTAKLEVWSEIKFNYGLIKDISRDRERPASFDSPLYNLINNFMDKIENRLENIEFTPIKTLLSRLLNRFNRPIENYEDNNPEYELSASDEDWLALGIGVVSPQGEPIPTYYEKYLNVAKENIFSPIVYEQELKSISNQEKLGLLFGFQSGHEASEPTLDVAFEIDFEPAFHIRTQFIPREAYVYYYFDTQSGCSDKPTISFTTNGFLENIELSLIFDNTHPLASTQNWMSFELEGFGFRYKGNKKHSVAVLVTSPSFSSKIKLNGIPTSVSCGFDVDLSFTYQQGQLLDAEGTASLELDMSSDMDGLILYYPELSLDEPKVEFVTIDSIPKQQELSANAHLYIHESSYTTITGEGYLDLSMSSSLGDIKAYYRKADPNDPDKLFIDVPYGIPASQRVGAKATLYMDMDDFSATNNYVYGKIYRTSSGNINEIDAYLPGESEPIAKITEIPAYSEGEAKIIWNKLQGYAYARRQSSGAPDPIELDIDLGTINIYNYFELRNGIISLDARLKQDGYFDFYTTNDMIADTFRFSDSSTGDQLEISADNVDGDFEANWDLDLNEDPIQINELSFDGVLSLLENFVIEASYQSKYLSFDSSWTMGQTGEISFDFTQDEPIEIVVDDLFQNNPMWELGGGVIIDQDFHFDMKWDWKQGEWGDRGEFKINEDTNDPNFDWIGINIAYDPDGTGDPKYGIEVGGTNVVVIVYMEWWKHPDQWLPQVWWYSYIGGNFYLDLLWEGDWYDNVHTW